MKTIRNVLIILIGNIILVFSIAAFLEPTGIVRGAGASFNNWIETVAAFDHQSPL